MDFSRKIVLTLLGLALCPAAYADALWVRQGGTDYLDLRAYGSANAYTYSWDPVAKNAVLEGAGESLRFHVGSKYLLKNGRLEKMQNTALYLNDSVIAPSSVASFLPAIPAAAAGAVLQASHRVRKIVIDAGHGGKDTGAVSARGLKEKRVVLEIARKVKRGLEAAGVQVVMTRSADVFIPLTERAHISNKNDADLFVSIHANASTSSSLSGFETYTLSEATDDQALALERAENLVIRFEPSARAKESETLETILWDLREKANRRESIRAAAFISNEVTGSVSVAARRQRSANFYVLKWTECPAVLVELAYLSNRTDERKLRDPDYKDRIARSIVNGLLAYRDEFERTNGYTS